MSDDGKVTFLIMATLESPNRWVRPFFVRAASIADAYRDVLLDGMFQHPSVKLEAHVVDISMIPNVKRVAQAYWNAWQKAEANMTFEEYWDEHGALPQED